VPGVLGFTAAAAIAVNLFVRTATGADAGRIRISGAGTYSLGVTTRAAGGAGIVVPVLTLGRATVTSGAAVNAGDDVASDAAGKAVTAAGAGTRVLGQALTTVGGAGLALDIWFQPCGQI
jgi:hypothetical protein